MTPTELSLYRSLKEQLAILERQIREMQELKARTEQDIVRMEEQQRERSQLDLFA